MTEIQLLSFYGSIIFIHSEFYFFSFSLSKVFHRIPANLGY